MVLISTRGSGWGAEEEFDRRRSTNRRTQFFIFTSMTGRNVQMYKHRFSFKSMFYHAVCSAASTKLATVFTQNNKNFGQYYLKRVGPDSAAQHRLQVCALFVLSWLDQSNSFKASRFLFSLLRIVCTVVTPRTPSWTHCPIAASGLSASLTPQASSLPAHTLGCSRMLPLLLTLPLRHALGHPPLPCPRYLTLNTHTRRLA